ncbi:MAG TPA: threonine synthase [Chloroflexia bacterium]|nr:threonine synthase [Chloroflexia bacterium]
MLAEESAQLSSETGSVVVRCIECGREHPVNEAHDACLSCGNLLEVQHPLQTLKKTITRDWIEKRFMARNFPNQSGVWRWRELVAPFPDEAIVSRREGNTNLYEDARLAHYAGVDNLWLKHEGENPTGSFKDRGMTVGISHANWIGAKYVACASSGNTSSSLAGYAARAGLQALTFIPAGKVALGKLSQTVAYGAKTIQVTEGSFDEALSIVRQVSRARGVYLVNSVNPFRLEGQKTIIFEALEQLGWQLPDWIVVPGGNLGNTSAFGKALYELRELGLIGPKLPRIAVIQAEGSSPFYNYYRNDFKDFQKVTPHTVATAIMIGNPVNLPKAVRALQWTNGLVEKVSDDEILAAKAHLDRSGIGGEPAAAATLAGIRKLTAAGVIKPGEGVVGVLTGHILKDPDSIINYHLNTVNPAEDANQPIQVRPVLEEVLRILE